MPTRTEVDRPWLTGGVPVAERVELLLTEMTLEEKVGLLFHGMITIGPEGSLAGADPTFNLPSTTEQVRRRHMSHFNILGDVSSTRELAQWHNHMQELAASTRLGVPVTVSTDPRHGFASNPGTGFAAGVFSQWPEPLGLAATRDPGLVAQFADLVRREYAAVGVRVALHPQLDLATEPRWSRMLQTFGEDVELVSELGAAYIRGLQGSELGPTSVAAMTKHFPGGGPQKDGEDPHFAYGREQVYPGGMFEHHLRPFAEAFKAGTSQIMPYYGMPIGTEYEEVGFGFNRAVLTGLLRDRFGFDGIICTDWGLVTDHELFDNPFPARAWGVEHLSPGERLQKILDAGADQLGGESCTDLLLDLVRSGHVSEERIDTSARRLLREKFILGLFDNPFVDEDLAVATVGSAESRALGLEAQRTSITVLGNNPDTCGRPAVLPLTAQLKLYVEGVDPVVAAEYGRVVHDPRDADVAIVRLSAPYERRATPFENFFHAGSLEFPEDVIEHLRDLAAVLPVITDVFLDRPAILGPILESSAALTANWGASDSALLDVLTGKCPARGKLPFDLPRSMDAVQQSRPDVPFDTADPLFPYGFGLQLP